MSSAALNGVSALLAVICFVFFLIATVGYSNENTTIQNVNWFHAYGRNMEPHQNLFVGLRRLVLQQAGIPTISVAYSSDICKGEYDDDYYYYYDDDADDGGLDGNNLCNVCAREGESAFGLMVLSTILSFIVAGVSMGGIAAPTAAMSGVNVVLATLASLFGVIGWGLFVYKCFDKIVTAVPYDMDYGPGAILSLIAFMLMFIVIILQIVAAILASKAAPPAPAAAQAPQPVATTEL